MIHRIVVRMFLLTTYVFRETQINTTIKEEIIKRWLVTKNVNKKVNLLLTVHINVYCDIVIYKSYIIII